MFDGLKKSLRYKKYGDPVVVVSGLPRSGTSMMMRMLEAAGYEPFQDGERAADVDNPKGYFEFERVKNLEHEADKSYIRNARGKALKVISFLLPFLPDDNDYRVIFMRRNLDEILASQDKMLDRLGTQDDAENEAMKEAYRNNIVSARLHARKQPNMELVEIFYRDTIDDAAGTAAKVSEFLGGGHDLQKMAEAVDKKLYRNRA